MGSTEKLRAALALALLLAVADSASAGSVRLSMQDATDWKFVKDVPLMHTETPVIP